MSDFYADRVAEGTATTGTGTLTLDNVAPAGYRTLVTGGAVSTNTLTYLTKLGSVWEISRGTFTSPATLTRTLLSSSTGALINWGVGSKVVSVILDASAIADALNVGIAEIPGLQGALDGKVDDAQVLTDVPAGAVFTDTVYTHPNHTGDVTSTGDGATVIAPNAVTNTKAADVPTSTIKGRVTAATGDPEDLTASQARTVLGLATTDSPTFTAVTLTDGQVVFPATQVPSANANTLDDYEKGTWTPVITFTTPGDLSVTHSTQIGNYVKIGDAIDISCEIQTSVFTHTTASGELVVNGVPFTSGYTVESTLQFQGITKASYTQFALQWAAATASLRGRASGSGQTLAAFTAADMPTGGTVRLFAALSNSV